jgi:hypothetical protein
MMQVFDDVIHRLSLTNLFAKPIITFSSPRVPKLILSLNLVEISPLDVQKGVKMKKLLMSVTTILVGLSILTSCGGVSNAGKPVQVSGIASGVSSSGFMVMGVRVKTTGVVGVQSSSSNNTVANGATVVVSGKTNDDGTITADAVSIKVEIKGSISSIDLPNASLVVLGQTIKADANTVFEGSDASNLSLASLKVTDFIEVYGLRQADNSLLASRIELEKGTKPSGVEVKGSVANLDTIAKTFSLGTQVVDYSSLTPVPTLSNGLRVEVKGTLSNNVFVASKLEVESKPVVTTGRIEIEGIGSNLNTNTQVITVQGYVVNYSSATVEGTPANGTKVEVHGTLNADGSVTAQKLEFRTAKEGFADADGKTKGTITALDLTAKTITLGGVIYAVDNNTIFEKMDAPIAFADLQVGSSVELKFVISSKLIRKLEVE